MQKRTKPTTTAELETAHLITGCLRVFGGPEIKSPSGRVLHCVDMDKRSSKYESTNERGTERLLRWNEGSKDITYWRWFGNSAVSNVSQVTELIRKELATLSIRVFDGIRLSQGEWLKLLSEENAWATVSLGDHGRRYVIHAVRISPEKEGPLLQTVQNVVEAVFPKQ